jgi:hypothetical protein
MWVPGPGVVTATRSLISKETDATRRGTAGGNGRFPSFLDVFMDASGSLSAGEDKITP